MHVSTNIAVYELPAALRLVVRAYASFLFIAFALTPAPDQRLYRAKREGRNCVIAA